VRQSSFNSGAIVFVTWAAALFAPAWCAAQSYTITTVAGNNTAGNSGDAGAATAAQLNGPSAIAVDAARTLYIVDTFNDRIRQVQAGGTISTAAGSAIANALVSWAGDGAAASAATLFSPCGVTVDPSGDFFIGDAGNNVIREVTPGNGIINTIAGDYYLGYGFSGDQGSANLAQMYGPCGVALDSAKNLFIADMNNNRIREMSAPSGTMSTFAGGGTVGTLGDGGFAFLADLNKPQDVVVDSSGNVYISDSGNHRVRMVSNGKIYTIAGNGLPGFSGDGDLAVSAQLNRPIGLALDAAGNLYIADSNNLRIRRVSRSGVITTIAGNGRAGYSGDGGPATAAMLNFPMGVAVDAAGNVYIADFQNNVIRMLTPPANPGGLPAISSGGVVTAGAFGGFPKVSPGSWIEIYGTNLASTTRSWADSDFDNLIAPTSLSGTSVTIGGQPAFVAYISPGQVNVQAPSNISAGVQQMTVTTVAGTSAPYPVTVASVEPGLLAQPSFNIGGKQYVVATFPDGSFALPAGAIPGVASQPAKPGDTVTLWGVGFGPVTPYVPAGHIATAATALNLPFQVSFGSAQATLAYAGLAPEAVGLYQFNVVVPSLPANAATPLSFTLNGASGAQTLYIAIGN
jgi:uncharacterized protein (TIGR03437 family)